jgi:hypothetical protein
VRSATLLFQRLVGFAQPGLAAPQCVDAAGPFGRRAGALGHVADEGVVVRRPVAPSALFTYSTATSRPCSTTGTLTKERAWRPSSACGAPSRARVLAHVGDADELVGASGCR